MKLRTWTIAVALVVVLLALGLAALLFWGDRPDLAQAVCQPGDLGERYQSSGKPPVVTNPYLEEIVVASASVQLIDSQLSNTSLDCMIIQYPDEATAHRAFEKACASSVEPAPPGAGDEACTFTGSAPRNLAFRRGPYLVLMSGDITGFPGAEVDQRLQ